MSTTKHTPGPWTVGQHLALGSLPIYQAVAGPRMEIAKVNGREGEIAANAALIASAPDLYDVLRRMDSLRGIVPINDEHRQDISDAWGDLWIEARAALAKAVPQ